MLVSVTEKPQFCLFLVVTVFQISPERVQPTLKSPRIIIQLKLGQRRDCLFHGKVARKVIGGCFRWKTTMKTFLSRGWLRTCVSARNKIQELQVCRQSSNSSRRCLKRKELHISTVVAPESPTRTSGWRSLLLSLSFRRKRVGGQEDMNKHTDNTYPELEASLYLIPSLWWTVLWCFLLTPSSGLPRLMTEHLGDILYFSREHYTSRTWLIWNKN